LRLATGGSHRIEHAVLPAGPPDKDGRPPFPDRGHEVKSLGDGFMIVFSSAQRAALCAMAVQRAFRAYSESHPDASMRVRIGLHVGPAIEGSSDLFGRSVVEASRIAGAARGGQIVASSALRDLLAEAGDVRFAPLGERQLKGFSAPYALFEVAW
jgi:adenylate cyclase